MSETELYGCVVVAQFGVQAALCLRPHLRGRAVVVMAGVRPLERVFSLNPQAAALGLRPGMTRVEVETFSNIETLPRCEADERASQALLRQGMSRFTPRMEELPADSAVDWECVLDLSGTARLLGQPDVLGARIVASMAALGFAGSLAVCNNVDAGLSLARAAKAPVNVVPQDGLQATLGVLPIAVLRLTEEQHERFALWGIATLGELAALPELGLIARLGQEGKRLRRRACGELPGMLMPAGDVLLLEEVLEFEEPVDTLEPLLFCLNPMLERLLAGAMERALAVASVTVSLWVERDADRVVEKITEVPLPPQILSSFRNAGESASPAASIPTVAKSTQEKVRDGSPDLARRIADYGRLPKPRLSEEQQLEKRLGMASADATVRKQWHRERLLGEAKFEVIVGGRGQATAKPEAALTALRKNDNVRHGTEDQGKWPPPFERCVRPAAPTVDRALLLKMIQLDLEAHSPEGAVVWMRVVAEAGRAGCVQTGLFAPPMPEPTRFEDTHARLVATVGEGNVGRVQPADTHAAENFVLERFVLPGALTREAAERLSGSRPATAVRRMRPPVEVRVMLAERRIGAFWFEGVRYDVERCFGPWRASGDWWGPGIWSGDTWDIAARGDDGDLLFCLLGRDLMRDKWVVEGVYD